MYNKVHLAYIKWYDEIREIVKADFIGFCLKHSHGGGILLNRKYLYNGNMPNGDKELRLYERYTESGGVLQTF